MTQSIPQLPELQPCPFCNHPVPKDLSDTLYPSGGYWRESEFGRHYFGIKESREGDGECWGMNCTQCMGGCGARINGDSMEEAIAKWNTRASPPRGMTPLTVTRIKEVLADWEMELTDTELTLITRDIERAHGIPTPPENGDSRVSDKGVDHG